MLISENERYYQLNENLFIVLYFQFLVTITAHVNSKVDIYIYILKFISTTLIILLISKVTGGGRGSTIWSIISTTEYDPFSFGAFNSMKKRNMEAEGNVWNPFSWSPFWKSAHKSCPEAPGWVAISIREMTKGRQH